MRRALHRGAALLGLALLAGCPETGVLLEVRGPESPTSVALGVVSLELLAAHRSYCERWVEDGAASRRRAQVAGRDLTARPFSFYVRPERQTDLADPVIYEVLARDAAGRVVAEASFGAHPFSLRRVNRYTARLEPLARAAEADGPIYVSDDGCACLPGRPWMGTGSGQGCDAKVVTSFPRLIDTAGCELAPGQEQLVRPLCDGQDYGDPADRTLPCFARASGGCAARLRTCHDREGVAWAEACAPDPGAPTLPTGALCDAYAACDRQPCGDPVACLKAALPVAETWRCTLRTEPTRDPQLKPCGASSWEVALPDAAGCVTTMLDGLPQGVPYVVGLVAGGKLAALSTQCPPTLRVETIAGPELPDPLDLDLTVGDRRVLVTLKLLPGCGEGLPAVKCERL